ncbi:MAG: hypothetical protein C5B51_27255, partial [Terriglobia bacterium]
ISAGRAQPEMKIVIHIDRLVLEGIPAHGADRARIRASVEGELARLVAEQGLGETVRSGGALPSAQAPPFAYPREPAQSTGEKIAQSVYAGLKGKR